MLCDTAGMYVCIRELSSAGFSSGLDRAGREQPFLQRMDGADRNVPAGTNRRQSDFGTGPTAYVFPCSRRVGR